MLAKGGKRPNCPSGEVCFQDGGTGCTGVEQVTCPTHRALGSGEPKMNSTNIRDLRGRSNFKKGKRTTDVEKGVRLY